MPNRRNVIVAAVAALGVAACAASMRSGTAAPAQPEAQAQPPGALAYAVGYYLGGEIRQGLEADGVEADTERLIAGFAAAMRSADPERDYAEMEAALAEAHNIVQERITERRLQEDPDFKAIYERNLARSQAFHESFGDQPGVQTLASGAQYRVIRAGDGAAAGPDATVVVTFRGALLDGRIFSEGEAVELPLSTVTPGVRELIAQMRPGDWWQLAVPPQLAYRGVGRPDMDIGPNETLIGDVQLLEVR